jgi:hypothetical protein
MVFRNIGDVARSFYPIHPFRFLLSTIMACSGLTRVYASNRGPGGFVNRLCSPEQKGTGRFELHNDGSREEMRLTRNT